MPGNYRYEEERSRGQRGMTRRGGSFGRGRDEDDMEQEGERYGAGSGYGREGGSGGRYQGEYEGWRGQGAGRDYGRSLGGRDAWEGYEEEGNAGSSYSAGGREERYGAGDRYGPSDRYGTGDRYGIGYGQGTGGAQRYGQGEERYGQGSEQRFGQGGEQRYGQGGTWQGGGQRYGQGGSNTWQGGRGSWGGGGSSYQGGREGGSMQADGWTGEPDEMRWGRQQGLYGSSEYGGYISSQRSQADYQSHVGKGPKGWQRSDERIREEVNEALARHPEIDASDIEVRVQGGEVTLTGTVTDRRAKRLAEDVAEQVFGAKDVTNQIKVNKNRFGDRDVTATADREARSGTEGQETQSRTKGTSASTGSTTR